MKLSYILEQARAGELASVSAKDKTDKVIIHYLNMAMQAVYNIFVLDTGEAIIALDKANARTIYTMDSTDAAVSENNAPMADGVYMIATNVVSDTGHKYTINDDKDNAYNVYTVSYNQLQVPNLDEADYLSVVYRKNPAYVEFVDDGTGKAVDMNVRLPKQLLEPVLHFIGYRAHGAINGNIQAENNTHYTRFLRSIQLVKDLGILPVDDVSNANVRDKGFM